MICTVARARFVRGIHINHEGVMSHSARFYTDSLALNGSAPRILLKTDRRGLPWMALIVNASVGFLTYMSLGAGSGKVFGWYVSWGHLNGFE